MWRAGPSRNGWDFVTESGVVHLVEEDAEKSSGFFVRIRLELGLDLNDEGRGHSREQTSLLSELAYIYPNRFKPHEYQGRVQVFVVFLHKLLIVLLGFLTVVVVESGTKVSFRRVLVLDRTEENFSDLELYGYKGRTCLAPPGFPLSAVFFSFSTFPAGDLRLRVRCMRCC